MSEISCPTCNATLPAAAQYAGQQFTCPLCRNPFIMPMMPPEPPPAPSFSVSPRSPSRTMDRHPQGNPGVAAVLSFFVPGLGQIYNGQVGKGLCMFVFDVIGIPLLIFAMLIISGGVAAANSGSPEVGGGVALGTIALALALPIAYWVWNIFDAFSGAS